MTDTERLAKMMSVFGDKAVQIMHAMEQVGHPKDLLDHGLKKIQPSWTIEKPAKSGWYFWRPQDGCKEAVREIIRTPKGLCTQMIDFFDYELRGQWAGPLEPPR